MVDLRDEVVYNFLNFSYPPEETSLAAWLFILKQVPSIPVKNIYHLGHDMVAFGRKKSHLAILELVAFRIVLSENYNQGPFKK